MSSNAKISVNAGVVNIDPYIHSWKLIGATCPTTLRREMGYVKTPFKFFPTTVEGKGSEDLVLMAALCTSAVSYSLFHIKRSAEGFVRVVENPHDAKDLVGASVNFQVVDAAGSLELQVGPTRFTSDSAALAAEDESVMIADADDILKFVVGRIKIGQLKAASRRALKNLGLRAELSECRAQREMALKTLRQKDRRIGDLENELALMRTQLTSIAERS